MKSTCTVSLYNQGTIFAVGSRFPWAAFKDGVFLQNRNCCGAACCSGMSRKSSMTIGPIRGQFIASTQQRKLQVSQQANNRNLENYLATITLVKAKSRLNRPLYCW